MEEEELGMRVRIRTSIGFFNEQRARFGASNEGDTVFFQSRAANACAACVENHFAVQEMRPEHADEPEVQPGWLLIKAHECQVL